MTIPKDSFIEKLENLMKALEAGSYIATGSGFRPCEYPDGSPMSFIPKDGYVHFDTKGNEYTWDGFAQIWFKKPNKDYDYDYNREYLKNKEQTKKCECGSEKSGSNKHSGYCPKYE